MTLGAGSRCQESTVITFEWDLMGLKEIFESSKDDEKSPLIPSSVFGGGRWQLHFYASAARASSCSLYIAAVPTQEELHLGAQNCLSQGGWPREGPHWCRRGPFSFTFEIKSLDGTIPIVARGPHEPMTRKEFTSNCSTWGYPQYVRRTEIFGDRAIAKANNGVKIICTMTHSLAPTPSQPIAAPMSRPVSPEIIDTMVDLFDNPAFSDVVFKFPRRRGAGFRTIYASKKLLSRRSEYFQSLFQGGFAEGSQLSGREFSRHSAMPTSRPICRPTSKPVKGVFKSPLLEELDELDEDDSDADSDYEGSTDGDEDVDPAAVTAMEVELPRAATPVSTTVTPINPNSNLLEQPARTGSELPTSYHQTCGMDDALRAMTPESVQSDSDDCSPIRRQPAPSKTRPISPPVVPSMQTIVVRDTAYLTYRALIFALYTDEVTFAPLASTFHTDRTAAFKNDFDFPYTTRRWYVRSRIPTPKTETQGKAPFPSSPKSLYKLADRLDIPQIKRRAFQAIRNSLNPRNVASEMFGTFSSLFPEVRKVELDYLLSHWDEVSHSDALMYDMNPFHPSSPSTPTFSRSRPMSARWARAQHRTAVTNQDIFVQLLQSLRPKSRRSAGTFSIMSTGVDEEDDVPMDGNRYDSELVA